MFRGCTSISNVCHAYARVLIQNFESVGLCSYNGLPFFDESLEPYSAHDPDAPIGIYYGIPESSQIPASFAGHPIKIGGFVCETDRIHADWVRVCNCMDLICVPSKFCKKAFIESGVRVPALVVPHGLDPGFQPSVEMPDPHPFIFFNTFDSGSFHVRKSARELIRTFAKTFGEDDGVELHLRTQPTLDIMSMLHEYNADDIVRVMPPDPISTRDLAALYSSVHCVVHPSKGEGFGLIPFQAIACERPVIAPAVTGMVEYLNASNAILLNTGERVRGQGVGNQCGSYYSIDEEHLGTLLRHVFSNWKSELRKVQRAGPKFRLSHSWPSALSGLIAILHKLKNSDHATANAGKLLSDLPTGLALNDSK